MKIAYFGEGDPAWFEPENAEDLEFIAEARRKEWDQMRTLAEAIARGLVKE